MMVTIGQICLFGWNSYIVRSLFETKGDLRNFCDKKIFQMWTPCLLAFYLTNKEA